ncbi:MAG: hypothetical protein HOO95_07900 [Gallionella sp.]|nr:hypothetical protein [Gallionella sp.]
MNVDERKSISIVQATYGLLLSCTLFFSFSSFAAEQPVQSPPSESTNQPFAPPALLVDPFSYVDEERDYLSSKFVSFTRSLDSFFADDRNYQESNNSLVQLDLVRVARYGGDRNFVLSGRAKLDLPSTEKRFHLLLETNPDKNVTGEPKQAQTTPLKKVLGPESYAAAVRYEKAKEQEKPWHLSSDLGVKFQGIHTNPFARARGSYAIPINEWRLKAAETVFWFNTIGAGETTQIDVERILSEPMLFRATSNATWLNDKQNFDLRQDFSVYQNLNERSALLYQASATGVSNPQWQLNEYVALMQYRYRLHKQWVFLEVSPQVHFPKADNFKANPAISFRLEMLLDRSD